MKTNTRILKFVAAAAIVAGCSSVASAAGLLGQRYAGATLDWVLFDNDLVNGAKIDDGRGFSLTLNQPLSSNVDFSVDYSFLDSGGRIPPGEGNGDYGPESLSRPAGFTDDGSYVFDAASQALTFNATFYMPAGNVKPFIKVGAGWAWTKIEGRSDNDAVYQIVPGVEIPAGDKASLTLFAAWQDYFDNEIEDDGSWDFGAVAAFDVSAQWTVLARGSVDEDSNYGISAGALFRF
jgi:opacity protein-like surface antigen